MARSNGPQRGGTTLDVGGEYMIIWLLISWVLRSSVASNRRFVVVVVVVVVVVAPAVFRLRKTS